MERMFKWSCAAMGALVSFFIGIPVIMWVLVGVMSLDYVSGLITGWAGVSSKTDGGGLSSGAAFKGLLKKAVILLVVLLAVLIDVAISTSAGLVSFNAISGAVCLWFVASEGVSVLENAAELGLPIPGVVMQALEIMKQAGGDETKKEKEDA